MKLESPHSQEIHNSSENQHAQLAWEVSSGEASLIENTLQIQDELFDDDSFLKQNIDKTIDAIDRITLSIKDGFEVAKNKLVEIMPSFIVRVWQDRYIDRFESIIEESIETSRAGGILYNSLSKNRLSRPTEDYTPIKPDDYLNEYLEHKIGIVEISKKLFNTSAVMRIASQLEYDRFRAKPIMRDSKELAGGEFYQVFSQSLVDETRTNVIEENVGNYLLNNGHNYCFSKLFVHNTETGKTLDLQSLLPADFSFRPGSMDIEQQAEILADKEGKEVVTYNYMQKNLDGYQGMQAADDDAFYKSNLNVVGYGDLSKKGGMIALLHEIAHAWHGKYRNSFSRGAFEDFYNRMSKVVPNAYLGQKLEANLLERDDNSLFEVVSEGMKKNRAELEELGIELVESGKEEKNSLKEDEYSLPYFPEVKIKTATLKPIIEEFVATERDAWAHAIRLMRFFRDKGIDIEPELQTPQAVSEIVHGALATYQKYLELQLNVPSTIKPFTNKAADFTKE